MNQKSAESSKPEGPADSQGAAEARVDIAADSPSGEAGTVDSSVPASDQPEASASAEASAGTSLESLAARIAELEDQRIRQAAEIENMRRRHSQELGNASKFAIESFAEALLPVADSLEMALSVQGQTQEGLQSGVELTLRQLQQAFERGRMTLLNPVGEKFDPNRQQAVSMVDGAASDPPVASGHVVAVMQKGYLIGERVLRPALVVVAS
ncbi:MAG: nucleotide exchange factor GrpE [Betaproteobacteria bacterium]|nr:nucleotide exchange factor GrpE [Betaproteobacteria bacterium]